MEDRAVYSSPLGTSFDEMMAQMLREDPAFREEYIRQNIEEGDPQALLACLRHVVDAAGGIGPLSKEIGLNRSQLYRTLSKEGRPEFSTVTKVLKWLGLHLTVERDRKMKAGARESRKPYQVKKVRAKYKGFRLLKPGPHLAAEIDRKADAALKQARRKFRR